MPPGGTDEHLPMSAPLNPMSGRWAAGFRLGRRAAEHRRPPAVARRVPGQGRLTAWSGASGPWVQAPGTARTRDTLPQSNHERQCIQIDNYLSR
jgi:hypothetical protein